MKKFLSFIIQHWYYFFIANTILQVFSFRDFYFVLVVVMWLLGVDSMTKIKWNKIDVAVAASMFFSIFSYFFSDYRIELFYFGVKNQLSVMFLYFIARTGKFRNDDFIENFKWPMLFIIVSGIVLYFFPPGWYLAFRYDTLGNLSDNPQLFYEMTRMSSFFSHPYFLGYGSCIMIIYIIKKLLIDKCESRWYYVAFFLTIFTLFFSQMRVAIAYSLLFLTLSSLYVVFIDKSNSRFFKTILYLVPISIIILFLIINNIDEDFLYYITERSTNKDDNFIKERINIFAYFFRYISVFGSGLGRFGHSAIEFNQASIADAEYLRILCELGYVGMFLLLYPIIYSVILGIKNIKNAFLETFVVLFFLFVMIGAAPLEMMQQHNFLLWFCVGHIVSKTYTYKSII